MTSREGSIWQEGRNWAVFLLPFIVYMLVGSLEPTSAAQPGGKIIGLAIPYDSYPWVYLGKIILTVAAIVVVSSGYKVFPLRLTWGALAFGILGGLVWIGFCRLDLEHKLFLPALQRIGLSNLIEAGKRAAYNPFEHLAAQPALAWSFVVLRFFGLVVIVPLIEEFFLRGFLMRFVVRQDWWNLPFGTVNKAALFFGTFVPMLMHPGELIAAAVWFSLISRLMVRTRNIWDCVAAHALTNLILGLYVVLWGGEAWRLL